MSKFKKRDANPKEDFEQSILAKLMAEQQQQSLEEQFASDVVVFFCGMKRSGKTSLVDRFINPKKDEKDVPKPTVALDYKYRREGTDNSSRVLAHIYDLGGDEGNDDLVAVPISPATVGNVVVCIVLDLSEPWSVLPSLERWLQLLRDQVMQSLDGLKRDSVNGAKRVDALLKVKQELYEKSPDVAVANPFPVPLVVFCTKWDVFRDEADPEKRKSLCRALRYFAHMNGASLVFSSVKEKEKEAMSAVRAILKKLVFGADSKGGVPEQLDPSKPISVQAGRDTCESIGKPHGAQKMDKAWRDLIATYFPAPAAAQGKDTAAQKVQEEMPKYAESSVDGVVAQRVLELEQYRRQVERNQRLASQDA